MLFSSTLALLGSVSVMLRNITFFSDICCFSCVLPPLTSTFSHLALPLLVRSAWNSLPDPVRNLNITGAVSGVCQKTFLFVRYLLTERIREVHWWCAKQILSLTLASSAMSGLGRLAAWHLPRGPVGPPVRWAATSNVEGGSGTEEGSISLSYRKGWLYSDKLFAGAPEVLVTPLLRWACWSAGQVGRHVKCWRREWDGGGAGPLSYMEG